MLRLRSMIPTPCRVPRARRGALPLLALVLAMTACGGSGKKSSGTTGSASDANNLVQAGLTAQSAGRLDEARQDYLAAIAKDPTNKFAFYDLGVIYQQQNNAIDATTAYNKAIAIDPAYKPALYNLAVLDTPTDPQAAVTLYQKLLTIAPDDANVHFNLGLLLRQIGQKAQGDAEVAAALRLDPKLASRIPPTTNPSKP